MQTVSIAEATENLPQLIAELNAEPLFVLDDGKVIAMIASPEAAEHERQASWRRFLVKRDQLAAELEASLAKDGLTVEEFLADVLLEDS